MFGVMTSRTGTGDDPVLYFPTRVITALNTRASPHNTGPVYCAACAVRPAEPPARSARRLAE